MIAGIQTLLSADRWNGHFRAEDCPVAPLSRAVVRNLLKWRSPFTDCGLPPEDLSCRN